MWKALWQKWTIDKPAILGDWLWDVLVVQFAAFLDRLTLRRIIALIPLIIVAVAYYHSVPLPPELVFAGDLMAYIDIVSVLFLFSVLSRATTILFILKQVVARAGRLTGHVMTGARRLDFRHGRERGSTPGKRLNGRPKKDNDEPAVVCGLAWA